MAERWDVVLFGATGVTGREVARYLGRRADELGITWAAAGRDETRVAASVASVGADPDGILQADTDDRRSIEAMAASAGVIINLVGPYARHGEAVYQACIDQGIVELDLTGELDWLTSMLARHQSAAEAAGARIVPTCGFEALPFDLAARYAAQAAFDRFGQPVVEVDIAFTTTSAAAVRRPADAISGGTWASALGMLRRGNAGGGGDAAALDPPEHHDGPRRYEMRPRRHGGTGAWLAPMIPSPLLNPPVAHRSAALLRSDGDPAFSPRYRYREGMVVGGPLGPVVAASVAGGQLGFAALGRAPGPVRQSAAAVLERVGPKSGQGPRPEDLDRWSYRLDVRALTEGGQTLDVVAEGVGHPGYRSTATLVAEAALILANDGSDVPNRSGFLTPATALGLRHLGRFAAAGLTFQVR